MTVVVWDKKTLAADCMAVFNGTKIKCSKITKFKHGNVNYIVAVSGTLNLLKPFKNWLIQGEDVNNFPEILTKDDDAKITHYVVVKNTKCFLYEACPYPIDIIENFAAWGTGMDIAYGALAMGADARQAVLIANQYDSRCGLGVEAYDV